MSDLGWIGMPDQLLYVLSLAGADHDAEGKFLIYGEPVFRGITGEDVVHAKTEYSIGGERRNLVALLSSTSYGTLVTVI
jgi:hypothetical protein